MRKNALSLAILLFGFATLASCEFNPNNSSSQQDSSSETSSSQTSSSETSSSNTSSSESSSKQESSSQASSSQTSSSQTSSSETSSSQTSSSESSSKQESSSQESSSQTSTSESSSQTSSSESSSPSQENAKSYKITFNTMRSGVVVESITQEEGSVLELPQPECTGYDFMGWYTESSYKHIFVDTTFPSKNMILYAKWTVQEYTLSFDSYNNGEKSESLVSYGDTITYPSPTKDGYSFDGWVDDKGNKVSLLTMPNYDVSLFGSWSIVEYNYQYELNGGTNDGRNLDYYTIEVEDNSLYEPTRTGYTFDGWYTDKEYKNRIYTYPLEDSFIYAKWVINQYEVSTSSTYGDYTATKAKYNHGSIITLPTLEEDGYTFLGWFDEEDTEYESGFKVSAAVSLEAKWEIINYKITYSLDNGTSSSALPETYNVSKETRVPSLSKEGYTFNGWYVDTTYKTRFVSFTLGDISLYAKFTINTYSLTYDENGGTDVLDANVNYGGSITLPNIIRVGYTFVGWYDDEDNKIDDSTFKMPSKNVELTAKWTINKYTLTYVDENGAEDSKEYDYYSDIVIKEASRVGYTFLGWYDDEGNKSNDSFKMPAYDVKLTVKYEAIKYTASYYYGSDKFTKADSNNLDKFTIEDDRTLADPYKKGYQLVGWYTEPTFENEVTTLPLKDVVLYAKMEEIEYTITYNYSGYGISSTLVTKYNINSDEIVLPTIDRTYSDFEYWYYKDEDNNPIQIEKIETGSIGDITLYALENDYFTYKESKDGGADGSLIGYFTGITAYGYSKLGTTITIPSTIDGHALTIIEKLGDNNTITKVTISEGYTGLALYAFRNWTSLKEVNLPESMETLGQEAFRNTAITSITFTSKINEIGKNCFRDTEITSLDFRNLTGRLQLNTLSLANMTKLTEVYLSNNFTVDGEIFNNATANTNTNTFKTVYFNCSREYLTGTLKVTDFQWGGGNTYVFKTTDGSIIKKDGTFSVRVNIYLDNVLTYEKDVDFASGVSSKDILLPGHDLDGYYYKYTGNYVSYYSGSSLVAINDGNSFTASVKLLNHSANIYGVTEGAFLYVTKSYPDGTTSDPIKMKSDDTDIALTNEKDYGIIYKYVGWYLDENKNGKIDDGEKTIETIKYSDFISKGDDSLDITVIAKYDCIYFVDGDTITGVNLNAYDDDYIHYAFDGALSKILEFKAITLANGTIVNKIGSYVYVKDASGNDVTNDTYFYEIRIASSITSIGFGGLVNIRLDSSSPYMDGGGLYTYTYEGTSTQFKALYQIMTQFKYNISYVICSDGKKYMIGLPSDYSAITEC